MLRCNNYVRVFFDLACNEELLACLLELINVCTSAEITSKVDSMYSVVYNDGKVELTLMLLKILGAQYVCRHH